MNFTQEHFLIRDRDSFQALCQLQLGVNILTCPVLKPTSQPVADFELSPLYFLPILH